MSKTGADMIGSPLTKDVDVAFEQSIVWVRGGPDDYRYLRESSVKSGTRARGIRASSGSLAAYATLRHDAPSLTPGRFVRRVWTFQSGDHDPGAVTRCPMQAVKPHSIAAARRSERGREER
jgi:hypothetical protein